jgi:hypothetical protein
MIQLTRTGFVADDPAAVEELAAAFLRTHCVRITQFLEPSLLRWLSKAIDRAAFVPRVHDIEPPATDLRLNDHDIRSTLLLLFNDRSLFAFIRRLSGCAPIGCFVGSVYRMTSELGHADSWHDDIYDGRMVALSLNLSPNGYRGGLLQLREIGSEKMLHEIANTGFGDAIVFRLSTRIEHRITAVESGPPKTAYAGWFKSHPARATLLRSSASR